MNRTGKRFDRVTEHALVPAALAALNCSIIHLAYACSAGQYYGFEHLAVLAVSACALMTSLAFRRRSWLTLATAFYILCIVAETVV